MSEEKKITKEKTLEIDYDILDSGPLALDPSVKKPGYVYQFVADRGNDIRQYQKSGYDIVIDDDIKVGSQQAATSTRFGSAVTVQSKCGALLVLMAITEANFNNFENYKFRKQQTNLASINKGIQGVPEEFQQFGGKAANRKNLISIKTNNNENG